MKREPIIGLVLIGIAVILLILVLFDMIHEIYLILVVLFIISGLVWIITKPKMESQKDSSIGKKS